MSEKIMSPKDLLAISYEADQAKMREAMDREVALVELADHRIDQERHVVVDDLDHRMRRDPAVLRELRRIDAQLRRARRALARELPDGDTGAVELLDRLGKVVDRDVGVVGREERRRPLPPLRAQP